MRVCEDANYIWYGSITYSSALAYRSRPRNRSTRLKGTTLKLRTSV